MGKRIRCQFMILLLLCVVTACDGPDAESAPSSEDVLSENELPETALDIDPQAPGAPAPEGEADNGGRQDEDIQRYLRQVTVQVQGPEYLGSGVVWAELEKTLVIATAAHVTGGNNPLTVQFYQGDPLEAELVYDSDQVDVAFLEVSLQEIKAREIAWQTARQDQEVCEQLEAGQPLWIMGSIEEAADRAYDGRVVEPWIYLEDFDNYMLLGHAYTIPGVSGGGVFTREGILVGILCGGNEADQVAVLPWSVMEANCP